MTWLWLALAGIVLALAWTQSHSDKDHPGPPPAYPTYPGRKANWIRWAWYRLGKATIWRRRRRWYRKYRNSKAWGRVRKARLTIDGYRCTVCGTSRRLEVHHDTYDHIGYEMGHLDDLRTLCRDHHQEVEDEKKGYGGGRRRPAKISQW